MVISNKEKTINLYKKMGWKYFFSYFRFWDAPLEALEKIVPKKGLITELGCGDGVLSNYLAISSKDRQLLGIDSDKRRLAVAGRKLPNTKYIWGDIRDTKINPSDAIIISHVLHHLSSFAEQEELIRLCKRKLKKNGKIIIMEIYIKKSPKYMLGWFFDHFLVPIFFEKRLYSKIYYRKAEDWEKMIKKVGLNAKMIDASKGKPISNLILICQE